MTRTLRSGQRTATTVTVLASTALIVTGCGDGGGDTSATSVDSSTTRKYTALNGTFEIPDQPQRIVTIGGSVGSTIAMGVASVGVSEQNDNFTEWLSEDELAMYNDATNVGPIAELDYEKIAALEPDLIITVAPQPVFESSVDEETLQNIAPTLFYEPSQRESWKDDTERIADIVNAEDAVGEDREEYDRVVDDITATYSDLLEETSFAFVNKWDASDATSFDREWAGFTCTNYALDLDMDIPGGGKSEAGGNTQNFSLENLPDLNKVDAVVYPLGADGTPKDGMNTILDSPLWKNLTPVKEGRAQGVTCTFGTFSYANGVRNLESMKTALAAMAKE